MKLTLKVSFTFRLFNVVRDLACSVYNVNVQWKSVANLFRVNSEELTPCPSLSREGKKGLGDSVNPPDNESGQARLKPGATIISSHIVASLRDL